MPNARELAYDLTRRVNSGRGYLSLLLRYKLDRLEIDRRERALVVELSYGIQRHRNKIDYIIKAFSDRDIRQLDPEVLDILRLGVYQLSEMRVPPHAAVNETVELASKRLDRGVGFVNAVLRNAAANLEDLTMPARDDISLYLETVHSHPRWLVKRLLDRLGEVEAEALCAAGNGVPGLTLRVNTTRADAASLLDRIRGQGGNGDYSQHLHEALIRVGLPRELLINLLEEGYCLVQDESSMLVGHAVHPNPQSTIVDACAAPGGKSTHLAQLGGEGCHVIAVDRNARRLEALGKSVRRLGLHNIKIKEGDAMRLHEFLDAPVDGLLLDAPCSGLGTLRRNPEIKWRLRPQDIVDLASKQTDLLYSCADNLKTGGVLVYSVCTFAREETTGVIQSFLSARDDYRLEDLSPNFPATLSGAVAPEGYVQLMPHVHNMDGMFIARMVRS